EPEGLWFKVLAVKYGIKTGQVDSGGSRASSRWKVIHSIRYETSTWKEVVW
ncbi:hypothetical protein A2U01_0080330, partial [Trifolium medium]|nr:hypothetical protein [Trifolium medium]